MSDRTADYFGKTVEQTIGDQWVAVVHPDDLPHVVRRWQRSLATGEPYEVEFRLWSAAHQDYRWHLGRATAQHNDEGEIIQWFGTNTELEDRIRAEAELQRLTREATEANRAKSDFLAAMSHELRTPLNAIGGYAQLLEMGIRGPITEDQRIDLLKIQRSKNHLDALVSDVLNFAKIGAGRIEFTITDVDVGAAIDAVLEMVAPQSAQKGVHLASAPVPPGLTLRGDEDKLRQILLNLITNALKFTPPDGTVRLDVDAANGDVRIRVSDTGVGIPPNRLEEIFEPFVQAERALRPADHGVGLGLAISRQLARAMQGDLTVVSTLGAGSTFTLTLPRA